MQKSKKKLSTAALNIKNLSSVKSSNIVANRNPERDIITDN